MPPLEAILNLTRALGIANISALPGAWQYQIDDTWHVAINGHDQPLTVAPPGAMAVELPPYHFCAWSNGWLAGILAADGSGEFINQAAFVEAVGRAIAGIQTVEPGQPF